MIQIQADKVAIQPVFDAPMIGSLYIPDQAKSRCKQGLVKYIGNEVIDVKVGDYVFFPGYTGTIFNIKGEGLLIIMKESSIVSRIDSNIWNSIDIRGLYFKDRHGEYWTASYEQAMIMITKSITENGLLFNVKDSGIKVNEE
jgi:co-chaperonin GroES (HSP10)